MWLWPNVEMRPFDAQSRKIDPLNEQTFCGLRSVVAVMRTALTFSTIISGGARAKQRMKRDAHARGHSRKSQLSEFNQMRGRML